MKTDYMPIAIDLVADVLIPPSGPWPAPSALGLGADLIGRLRERETQFIAEALAFLDAPDQFSELPPGDRVVRIAALESAEPAAFDVLRRCVYYAYYAQPAVIRALRGAGYDINESPQPEGYRMDPFTTDLVKNVDRSRAVWIPLEQVGTVLKAAS